MKENSVIKEQLNKVREADLSNFDESTNTYFIPKKINIPIKENNFYLIELNDCLLTNSPSLEGLINNWNQGNIPNSKYYNAEVIIKINNMIKINGLEFNPELNRIGTKVWNGWLPIEEIKIIKQL